MCIFRRLVERQGRGLQSRWLSSFKRRLGQPTWWVDSWRHIHWLAPRSRAIFSHPAATHWLSVRSDASLQWARRPKPDHISDPAPSLVGGHPACWVTEVQFLPGSPKLFGIVGASNTRTPPALSHAPCVQILTTARAPHARAQTSGGGHQPTSPPLPLWLAPLLVGRRRGGRSCRCGPSAAACGACMCYTHVHGSPR